MEEIWKDIKGYEGYYQVSNLGNVRSLDRIVLNSSTGIECSIKGVDMKKHINRGGYLHVTLHRDGKPKTFTIHRLVAINFIPNKLNLPQVNHKNENKTDNRVENLEWCDAEYNNNYGGRNNKISKLLRNNSNNCKKIYQYDLDGKFIRKWLSSGDISRNTSFDGNVALMCCKKQLITAYNYQWSFYKKSNIGAVRDYNERKKVEVYQFDTSGNFIKKWDSIKDICESTNFKAPNISQCCRGFTKTAYGYIWSHYENFNTDNKKPPNTRSNIYQYSLDLKLIKVWNSALSIEKDLGISRKYITKNCKGLIPNYRNFIWSYSSNLESKLT